VTGKELDRATRGQLRTLSKDNADGVAKHLVMVARLLEVEPQAALAHAETAARRAGRVAAVREALGLVAYRLEDFPRALREFRTARRLAGTNHLVAHIADCERGLGRPQKALDELRTAELSTLTTAERIDAVIVASGARRDLGQFAAAVAVLEIPALKSSRVGPRLAYAYADALLASGDSRGARDWFARAAALDPELETDAAERLDELDGVIMTDLLPEEGQDEEPDTSTPDTTSAPSSDPVQAISAADAPGGPTVQ
jgi:tetratricopeptide (TPR) repeat protein